MAECHLCEQHIPDGSDAYVNMTSRATVGLKGGLTYSGPRSDVLTCLECYEGRGPRISVTCPNGLVHNAVAYLVQPDGSRRLLPNVESITIEVDSVRGYTTATIKFQVVQLDDVQAYPEQLLPT